MVPLPMTSLKRIVDDYSLLKSPFTAKLRTLDWLDLVSPRNPKNEPSDPYASENRVFHFNSATARVLLKNHGICCYDISSAKGYRLFPRHKETLE